MIETVPSTTVIDAFIEKHSSLKALPETTSRILRMTSDQECNTHQLLKLISQDTALAGSIMKAINSAFYALQTKITRLDRAVALLGLRAVKEVTLSSCLSNLCKPVRLGSYDARDLWDHSVGVAILTRELAIQSTTIDPEEGFLAGMMHDIALLLALQSEVETGTKLIGTAESGTQPFICEESNVFGFNHCELGERLAGKWNLVAADRGGDSLAPRTRRRARRGRFAGPAHLCGRHAVLPGGRGIPPDVSVPAGERRSAGEDSSGAGRRRRRRREIAASASPAPGIGYRLLLVFWPLSFTFRGAGEVAEWLKATVC